MRKRNLVRLERDGAPIASRMRSPPQTKEEIENDAEASIG
jgi:hypothetical protein